MCDVNLDCCWSYCDIPVHITTDQYLNMAYLFYEHTFFSGICWLLLFWKRNNRIHSIPVPLKNAMCAILSILFIRMNRQDSLKRMCPERPNPYSII